MLPAALLLQAAPPSVSDPAESLACKQARQGRDIIARDRACLRLKPDRIYEGIYVDAFEGEAFVEGATSERDVRGRQDASIDMREFALRSIVRLPPGYVAGPAYRPRLFRIRFRGTEPADGPCTLGDGQSPPRLCCGHMGMFPRLVVADHILSAEYLGELSPQER